MASNKSVTTEKHAFASDGNESAAQEWWRLTQDAANVSGKGVTWLNLAGDRARIQYCAELLEDVLDELRQAEAEADSAHATLRSPDQTGDTAHG